MSGLTGERDALLRMEGVTKTFPNGTAALRGVDLTVHAGSVHGLVGANGAGKSTLIKILSGVFGASGGAIRWDGAACAWRSPADAQASGVATIHQHIPLAPTLTVLENVFLARGGWRRRTRAMRAELAALCERVAYPLEPDAIVGDLPMGKRQMVAILQALATGARLIVMDEPTASLAQTEREVVFAAIRRVRDEGAAVLYVSHFLDEIVELTDRVTVLRDGAVVAEDPTSAFDETRLVETIVGERVMRVAREEPPDPAHGRAPALEVVGLSSPGRLRDVSLSVAAGEIVGVAGLLGSGRSELLEAIFGADRHARGTIRVGGAALRGGSTAAAVRAGLALVPEDRMRQGLIPDAELWRNVALPDLAEMAHGRVVPDRGRELARAEQAIASLSIRTPGPRVPVRQLSGGNAQKVVFAKWLSERVRVFLLDEPTAGIDIGAKAELWGLVRRAAAEGRGVVIVSDEFEELLALTHRIVVMRDGRVVAERTSSTTTEHELLMLASGLAPAQRGRADHAA